MEPRVVCARCAKIKQACDGGTPCSRCKRLRVICELGHSASERAAWLSASSGPVQITRAHTGCTSCRKRKRKCDEARPKCSDCRRLCLECHYLPPPTRKRQKASIVETAPVGTPLTDTSVVDSESSAASQCDESLSLSLSHSESVESWWPVPLTSPSTFFDASWTSLETKQSTLPLNRLSTAPMLAVDEDKSLLNHYIKVVAVVLSRRDGSQANPYLSKMLTVAFSNQLVMDALLALSANHWKKLEPSVWKRGVIHQTNAIQSLARLLPKIDSTSTDVALASTLLLAMIELFDGTSSHWRFHLDGVRQLLAAIEAEPEWARRTEYFTFFCQLYHFLDSATTISTCHPPLRESPKDSDERSPSYDMDDEGALYGIPRSLFHFVDKLNSLAYQRKFREDSVFESMFRASAESLEKEINEWSAENKRSNPIPNSDTQYATIAFEQALRLRLHQVAHGYSLKDAKVKEFVDLILETVQEIRYGSPAESSLVFALVMAGSACDDGYTKRVVQDRFLVMERTVGFQYVYTAHDLLERVWAERDLLRDQGMHEDVNWAAIRYFHIPGLALV